MKHPSYLTAKPRRRTYFTPEAFRGLLSFHVRRIRCSGDRLQSIPSQTTEPVGAMRNDAVKTPLEPTENQESCSPLISTKVVRNFIKTQPHTASIGIEGSVISEMG